MTDSIIHYDKLVQMALLSVVRDILKDAAQKGLPGDHHFYLTFSTEPEEVIIPPYLRERYPEEMTIIIQNQYWDFVVEQDYFEVGLSFNQKRELLKIPFEALIGFFDPSVDFGLHFHAADAENENTLEQTIEPEAAEDQITQIHSEHSPVDNDEDNVVTLDTFRKKTWFSQNFINSRQ